MNVSYVYKWINLHAITYVNVNLQVWKYLCSCKGTNIYIIDLARNRNSVCANEILGCTKCHFWWKSPWKWKNLGDFMVCNKLNCWSKTQVHGWLANTMIYIPQLNFLFYFSLFQIYLYRVNHLVTLFFHGALLESEIHKYKEHIYTHS